MAQGKWGAACLCVPWPTNASRRPSGGLAGTMAAPGRRGPVGPSPEVPTAWSLSTGISSLPPALSVPLAMRLVIWWLVPQPQALEDKMGMMSLHHHHYTHTHTHSHSHTQTSWRPGGWEGCRRRFLRKARKVSGRSLCSVGPDGERMGRGKGLRGSRGWWQGEKGLRVHKKDNKHSFFNLQLTQEIRTWC